jgi:hypothetical protein
MMKRMRSAPRHLLAIAVAGAAVLTLSGCLLDPGAVPGIVNNAERRTVEVVTTSGPAPTATKAGCSPICRIWPETLLPPPATNPS